MRRVFLLIILIYHFSLVYAQQPQMKFRHLKVQDGLSQSWVRSICQDRQGFMWFGTYDGLNKYDGYTITSYYYNPKNKNSLNSGAIESIYEDSRGNLLIGTEGGLNRYDRANDKFIRHNH
jgi:two-component system sensor histidine kinase ChiS